MWWTFKSGCLQPWLFLWSVPWLPTCLGIEVLAVQVPYVENGTSCLPSFSLLLVSSTCATPLEMAKPLTLVTKVSYFHPIITSSSPLYSFLSYPRPSFWFWLSFWILLYKATLPLPIFSSNPWSTFLPKLFFKAYYFTQPVLCLEIFGDSLLPRE